MCKIIHHKIRKLRNNMQNSIHENRYFKQLRSNDFRYNNID